MINKLPAKVLIYSEMALLIVISFIGYLSGHMQILGVWSILCGIIAFVRPTLMAELRVIGAKERIKKNPDEIHLWKDDAASTPRRSDIFYAYFGGTTLLTIGMLQLLGIW